MNSNTRIQTFGKPLRLMICATLALAITALTTQVIISSAGQHEYGIAYTTLPPVDGGSHVAGQITVARLR
ncbi:MAG TPA: hypothetical protein VII41_18310 [Steroidobacteraceae bacterium]|jgi:hypothetical protein